MRPFVYATNWSYQFEIIDERVKEIKAKYQQSEQTRVSKVSHKSEEELTANIILPPPIEQTDEIK